MTNQVYPCVIVAVCCVFVQLQVLSTTEMLTAVQQHVKAVDRSIHPSQAWLELSITPNPLLTIR
jgi:hypothetical protein